MKGGDLPSGKNHASYIESKSKFDLFKYYQDHKNTFSGLSKVFIGALAPHITTEVDCESHFVHVAMQAKYWDVVWKG